LESTPARYRLLMDRMPSQGNLHPGYLKAPGRRYRMIYSDRLQAMRCAAMNARVKGHLEGPQREEVVFGGVCEARTDTARSAAVRRPLASAV
jgi:hypothetical protein